MPYIASACEAGMWRRPWPTRFDARLSTNFRLTPDGRFGLGEEAWAFGGITSWLERGLENLRRAFRRRSLGGSSNVDTLLAFSRAIDAINSRLGKWLSWLILIVVLISATNAT